MTRNAISIALVLLMLVQIAPLSPFVGEADGGFEWEIIEKNDQFAIQELNVWTHKDDLPKNDRIDELHVDVEFQDTLKMDYIIFTELSSEFDVSEPGIQQAHVLNESQQKLFLTYQGTEIYLARLNFPLILTFTFLGEKGEEDHSSYRISGDHTFLDFESPYPVGFEDGITSQGISEDGTEKFATLNVSLSLFAREAGLVTIVGELRADIEDPYVPRGKTDYDLKVGDNTQFTVFSDTNDDSKGVDPVDNSGTRSDITGIDDGSPEVGSIRSDVIRADFDPGVAWMEPGSVIDTDISSYKVDKGGLGIHSTNLTFSGSRIYSTSWDGPFILTTYLYFNNSYIETMEWIIEGNPHDDYEPAKVYGVFSSTPHQVKVTRDGTELTVFVDIAYKGTFNLSAEAVSTYSVIEPQYTAIDGEADHDSIEKVNVETEGYSFAYIEENLTPMVAPQSLTLTFYDEIFLDETIIRLTLTTLNTGGWDRTQIQLKPTEPTPGGPTIIEEVEIKDQGIDDNGDRKFENLSVLVFADIPGGRYHLDARLYSPENGIEYVISGVKDELKVEGDAGSDDRSSFEVLFPGEDIFISGIDGQYTVLFYLTAENETIYVIKGITHKYASLDFSPVGGRDEPDTEPEFSLTNNSIFLHTDIFASEVLRNSPELVFYYYTDMGESVSFRVKFTRLIAFNDDGDGLLEGGEDAYEAFLSTKSWTMSQVSHGVNSKLGSHLSFNMSTGISLHSIQNDANDANDTNSAGLYIRDWGRLTLHFLIANNSVDETEFKIRGGEELKITVEIDQFRPLDINTVTLEQKIFLLQDGDVISSFNTLGEDREAGLRWNDDLIDGGSGSCENSSTSQLSFENNFGQVMGYYSWACTAQQYLKNGTTMEVDVGSHAEQGNNSVVLLLTYPMSKDVRTLEHDPSVGVLRDNAPPPTIESIIDLKEELEANPWSYLLGLLLAGSVVFVTIFQRRPKPIRPIGGTRTDSAVMKSTDDEPVETFAPPPPPAFSQPDPPPTLDPPSSGNGAGTPETKIGDQSNRQDTFDPSSFMPEVDDHTNSDHNSTANNEAGMTNNMGNGDAGWQPKHL